MIKIKVNDAEQLINQFSQLENAIVNKAPLMQQLAGTMQTAVDRNFAAGGRPKWLGLKARQGKPLIDSGELRNSIQQAWGNDYAMVGTNLPYAALHHFGGTITAKRAPYLKFKVGDKWVQKKQVTIPARPFMLLTEDDKNEMIQDIQDYFQKLI
ncbi:phage virion morphogenesis protein [Gallibacterium trehalosifermentans]|uniref:Phage virion morphogenesis protein n=1 Tax=Gallibacterium trehalosifermentans TaxID=516935 RepID=A0ABV6H3W2_9PAST